MNLKINYRPEIDGLRAIAVVSVVLYHAQIFIPEIPLISKLLNNLFFKGGFIGVDIFFVISGYLITSIILKELIITGSFSFKYFYERRIRRILPGLLFIVLLSFPLGWFFLLPSGFVDLVKSILYSIGFTSNFYFYFTANNYWAEVVSNPLLHTWSLSIEEQYYIFFPALMLISFKFFKKYLLQILIISLLISLVISEFGSRNYPEANFYLLHARIWELIAGSLLAYYEINRGHRSKNKLLNQILPIIGITLVTHSILFFDVNLRHPSLITLSPIIGVCLIIWFSNKNGIITKILSTKLFVGIGLISYSLYMCHYVLFTFAKLGDFIQGDFYKKIILMIVVFVISIFSYFFVEKPARNKNIQFKIIITNILLVIILSLVVSFLVLKNNGFEKRFSFNIQGAYPGYSLDTKKYYDEAVKFEMDYNYDNFQKNKKNVFIIGNSHAKDILQIFSNSKLAEYYYFYTPSAKIRKNNFTYQVNFFLNDLDKIRNNHNNDDFNDNFLNHFNKQYKESDIVILATGWSIQGNIVGNSDDISEINLINKIHEILNEDDKKLIIIDKALMSKTYVENNFNRFDYFIYKNKRFPNQHEIEYIEKQFFIDAKKSRFVNQKLAKIANEISVKLIQRKDIFCDIFLKKCNVITDDGKKIYRDRSHLTNAGAKFFSKKFDKINFFD